LVGQVEAAARAVGLVVQTTTAGADFSGRSTTRFALARVGGGGKTHLLELSDGFDAGRAEFQGQMGQYLSEVAERLKNPRPECALTLHGLPLSFGRFEWPFHQSSSGADTSLVHGEVRLETGEPSVLHAKIAASMTKTFAEVVAAPEQPFAEGFIYNAVRKTMDQGQLELVKSGNRQPVPVTTRYYSAKQGKFIFNDTTEAQRRAYLAAKAYWLSGVLGGGAPVWLLDPRDAQYLNASVAELDASLKLLVQAGLVAGDAEPGFGRAGEALMGRKGQYEAELQAALAFIKPSFNEEMRGGHTNM
jgi:hypothetical protein